MTARTSYTINVGGKLLDLSSPVVMGILNVTPDSFYASSRVQAEHDIAARADEIVAQGGAIIDVGAYSTRPGAAEVSEEEEMRRLRMALGVVRRRQPDAVVSVDTFRPGVVRMVVEEFGPVIVNDVSEGGLGGIAAESAPTGGDMERLMFKTVARLKVPYILTSIRGGLTDMLMAFAEEVNCLRSLGAGDIILDPGFGFGKSLEQNYHIMARLERIGMLGLPLLVGVSRKSMITRLLGCSAADALPATTALHAYALTKGASILRVHDVKEAVEVCRVMAMLEEDGLSTITNKNLKDKK